MFYKKIFSFFNSCSYHSLLLERLQTKHLLTFFSKLQYCWLQDVHQVEAKNVLVFTSGLLDMKCSTIQKCIRGF